MTEVSHHSELDEGKKMTEERGTPEYASIDLFRVHILILNSERLAIWHRYTAFLVANSIILVFLKDSPYLYIVGLILCVPWILIHVSGYIFFFKHTNIAATQFSFTPMPVVRRTILSQVTDLIFLSSMVLILVFVWLYFGLART